MSGATEQAYTQIRQLLVSKSYPPGSRLSETELSEKCGVSRTPVREALRRLALEYLVQIVPNRGAFVTDWSQDDIMDMFEMRAMMEGLAARKAANRANQEQIDKMYKLHSDIDNTLSQNSKTMREKFLKLNREFHDTVFEASQSPRLADIIARFVDQAVIVRTASQYSREDIIRSNQHHKEIVDAIASGNGVLAEHVMRTHILLAIRQYHESYAHEPTKK